MATAPKPSVFSSTIAPKKWVIRLGATDGTTPTAEDETTLLRWPILSLSHGSRGCYAEFTYALEKDQERVADTQLKAGFARQVEIVQTPAKEGMPDTLIFWGEIGGQLLSVNKTGESIQVRATIEDYHFGTPCLGPVYREPVSPNDPFPLNDPIVFNPLINGVIEGNQSSKLHTPAVQGYRYFLHPDSVRTTVASTNAQDGTTASLWTLNEAVIFIMRICNPDEDYVTNPGSTDVDAWLADAPDVKNLELPTGKYLPEYLDRMLNPYGYGWTMTFAYNSDNERVVSWRIFTLNDDQKRNVLLQKPGDVKGIRTTLHNVESVTVDESISGQANEITAMGDFEEYEITCELYRGWPESEDALTADGLTQSTGADWETHQRAWRLWVANEGGDYCGTRTVVAPIPSTPPDWSSFLGSLYIPKNREPMDCLTHWKDDADGSKKRRRPPFIQWYNESNEWAALPSGWGETVLSDNCAVMFAGDAPPAELIARGSNARIRMTFTIRGDERRIGTASKAASSVNARTNKLVIDVSDRYKYRRINQIGDNASVLDGLPSSDARDDSTALEAFAEKMRVIEDAAVVRATIVMFGLHPELKIGMTIGKVLGREISFNRMSTTSATKKYCQIVQIRHDHQRQQTVLTIAPITEGIE